MKAKQIKRIRKKIGKLDVFTVRETFSLFGDFFGNNRMCMSMYDHKISCGSPERAVEKYMKKYRREYKRKNEHEREHYLETTERWGKIMVKNHKFTWFYK